jgi:hypothetical protein
LRQPWSVALHARSAPRGSCAASRRASARRFALKINSAISDADLRVAD